MIPALNRRRVAHAAGHGQPRCSASSLPATTAPADGTSPQTLLVAADT
jgi:hypothetical protein